MQNPSSGGFLYFYHPMQLFYSINISGGKIILDKEESRHAFKVLRAVQGDILHVTDGEGNLYEAELLEKSGKNCELKILEHKTEPEKSFYVHLAVAPTKNIGRFEWFLEKAVEIGVDEITPLVCEHSERRHIRTDRLDKILISAMKQSLKWSKPKLNDLIDLKTFIGISSDEMRFIGYCSTEVTDHLFEKACKDGRSVVLIGPEGDFSEREVGLAMKSGFVPISLGSSRLRTETAAVVACHVLNLVNEIK